MIHRDNLPDTPDFTAPDRSDHTACSNCTNSQRFCTLMREWNRVACCSKCHHDKPQPLVWLGDNA